MSDRPTRRDSSAHPPLSNVMERNIESVLGRWREEERRKGLQERMADAVTRFTGSMVFVYLHLVIFGAWIAANLGWLPVKPFDPDFVTLAMIASVEAIFLSTFVLITQNRMAAQAEQRAELDLQVSLLAEHEITRILNLVTAVAERMGLEQAQAPDLAELGQDVRPEKVLDKIQDVQEKH